MSILIKGMEMPKNCHECGAEQEDFWCGLLPTYSDTAWFGSKRRDDCPLVSVPPHGRLIDAREFYKAFKKWLVKFYAAYEKDKKDERIAALLELDLAVRMTLEDAPTIIEAEEKRDAG